ncbi:MAG: hypothetical protein F6K30_19810 [Cyanothece sp. SIO2G6]|nr:hypothetical protein [Cyanothece sp. SIO2G6]
MMLGDELERSPLLTHCWRSFLQFWSGDHVSLQTWNSMSRAVSLSLNHEDRLAH